MIVIGAAWTIFREKSFGWLWLFLPENTFLIVSQDSNGMRCLRAARFLPTPFFRILNVTRTAQEISTVITYTHACKKKDCFCLLIILTVQIAFIKPENLRLFIVFWPLDQTFKIMFVPFFMSKCVTQIMTTIFWHMASDWTKIVCRLDLFSKTLFSEFKRVLIVMK